MAPRVQRCLALTLAVVCWQPTWQMRQNMGIIMDAEADGPKKLKKTINYGPKKEKKELWDPDDNKEGEPVYPTHPEYSPLKSMDPMIANSSDTIEVQLVSLASWIYVARARVANWDLVKLDDTAGVDGKSSQDFVGIYKQPTTRECALVFAGTDDMANAKSDMDAFNQDWCGLKGVHRGWALAVTRFLQSRSFDSWNEYLADQSQCSKVYVVGHSMGAAMAELFTACQARQEAGLYEGDKMLWKDVYKTGYDANGQSLNYTLFVKNIARKDIPLTQSLTENKAKVNSLAKGKLLEIRAAAISYAERRVEWMLKDGEYKPVIDSNATGVWLNVDGQGWVGMDHKKLEVRKCFKHAKCVQQWYHKHSKKSSAGQEEDRPHTCTNVDPSNKQKRVSSPWCSKAPDFTTPRKQKKACHCEPSLPSIKFKVAGLFTIGSPSVSTPRLENPLVGSGCFPGLRIYNQDRKTQDFIPAYANLAGFKHIKQSVLRLKLDKTGVVIAKKHNCQAEPDPKGHGPKLANLKVSSPGLHLAGSYCQRIADACRKVPTGCINMPDSPKFDQ